MQSNPVENYSRSWRLFQGQLPDHPNHPKGRNPYAHVALCVKKNLMQVIKIYLMKNIMKLSNFIEFLKKNPSW